VSNRLFLSPSLARLAAAALMYAIVGGSAVARVTALSCSGELWLPPHPTVPASPSAELDLEKGFVNGFGGTWRIAKIDHSSLEFEGSVVHEGSSAFVVGYMNRITGKTDVAIATTEKLTDGGKVLERCVARPQTSQINRCGACRAALIC
jgi:hypothetical protein